MWQDWLSFAFRWWNLLYAFWIHSYTVYLYALFWFHTFKVWHKWCVILFLDAVLLLLPNNNCDTFLALCVLVFPSQVPTCSLLKIILSFISDGVICIPPVQTCCTHTPRCTHMHKLLWVSRVRHLSQTTGNHCMHRYMWTGWEAAMIQNHLSYQLQWYFVSCHCLRLSMPVCPCVHINVTNHILPLSSL